MTRLCLQVSKANGEISDSVLNSCFKYIDPLLGYHSS